ncbi:MAG: hypothetical protein HFI86_00560 [Bacilli bacterium]|nr:hypothetical protein [Bacilli bacterium]
MELMRLTANNRIYNIFSDNINTEHPKIYGYIYENNHFYPLNEDVFKELNKLKIGNNAKKIGDYEKDNHSYDVILDLDTNLKHYFLNGKENFNLFINNFEDVIIADNRNIKYTDNLLDRDKKLDNTVRLLRVTSLSLLIFAECNFISKLDQLIDNNPPIESTSISDSIEQTDITTSASIEIDSEQSIYLAELMNNTPTLTADIMSDLIKNNKNINDSDKEILLNSGIIEFASQYVNENKEYAAKLYNIILPNFTIVEKDMGEKLLGTWNSNDYTLSLNLDLIKRSNGENFYEEYKEVMLHEFSHLFQPPNEYSFLFEGCATIMGKEFHKTESVVTSPEYEYNKNIGDYEMIGESSKTVSLMNKYSFIDNTKPKYTAILMEIIGKEPVIRYNFTGSIEPIKEELEKYLPIEDVNKLLEIYKRTEGSIGKTITEEQWQQNISNMKTIYSFVYYNKYNCSMRANSAINKYLEALDYTFSKYYFNNCDKPKNEDDLYDALNYKLATNTYHPAYNQISVRVDTEDLLNDLDFFTLKQAFYNNQNLSNEEKDILFNEELINDYIYYTRMYLNDRISENGNVELYYNHYNIIKCLKNLRITNDDRCIIGSDSNDKFPYRISAIDLENCEIVISENNCKQYASKNNLLYADVYKKEKVEQFVKLLSENYSNYILYNACINIILEEYYGIELSKKDELSLMEEKATKILMELVGSESLKYYYFTGSDKLIREKLSLFGYDDIENAMNCFEDSVLYEEDIPHRKRNLNITLFDLYNMYNNKTYDFVYDSNDYGFYDNIANNYMNNYYIPETKGYFSKSYIEKDKLSHPENYSNISFEENNGLGKRR